MHLPPPYISGGLIDAKLGKDIDSHDIVVRLNVAPVNNFEAHVGAKTSFRLLNTLWSARYASMKRGAPWAKKTEEIPLVGLGLWASGRVVTLRPLLQSTGRSAMACKSGGCRCTPGNPLMYHLADLRPKP